MPEWVLIFVIVPLVSVITCELVKRALSSRAKTYKWKCPQCEFKIKTQNRETYEISRSSHNHDRLREFRPQ